MTINSRAKGQRYERELFLFFDGKGFDVENKNRSGHDGDDHRVTVNSAVFSVEAKNHKKMNLSGWLNQATGNAGEGELPIVFHKRTGKADPSEHYVTMSGATFVEILNLLDDSRPKFTSLELRKLLEVVEPRMIDALGLLEEEPADDVPTSE